VEGNSKTKYGMRSSPKTLGWTEVESKLNRYKFVVPDGDEPYFELLLKAAATFDTPETVYLDKHQ
jgi:hypothetical protein